MSVSNLLVIAAFFFILLFGNKIKKLSCFRKALIGSMIPALVIALIYVVGFVIGTLQAKYIVGGILGGFAIFCLATLGLAFAKGISNFEPLPIAAGSAKGEGRLHQFVPFLLAAILLAILILATDMFKVIFLTLFHESDRSVQAIASLPTQNKLLAFPLLLAGAGIAEESMFRLFFQSLFWRLFKKPWIAILLSSFCFAFYHLTPADPMYQVYWQYPLTQVSTVFLSAIVLGWFYRKRGFETAVLGHTFSDYVGVLLSH